MRRTGAALLLIVTVATVSGCSVAGVGGTPTPTNSAGSPVQLDKFTPAPSGVSDEDSGETYSPYEVPVWDDESRQSVIDAAEAGLTAFARPDLPFDAWWANVRPLLDEQAAKDYGYMNPAVIPANSVTGPGVIVDDTSAYVAKVEVPTNVGTYTVVLARTDAEAPWLISRFTPPDGVN